ncbi:MAG TPA: 3-phosphoglycerate dehydrogenase [Desulfobacterales bacterium]|nr:3-phosphoglycerate dehydrogenase [Desulfobacterales bacterium]
MRIKTLNNIAAEGLALLGADYETGPEIDHPQAIIVRSSSVNTTQYPDLLAVARAGAGVNNITVTEATQAGVCVFNTPGANANAVAELVFMMLGVWARNLHQAHDFCRQLSALNNEKIKTRTEAEKSNFKGFELAGKTLGVLGLGQIGIKVANGGAFRRMRVIGFDPNPALKNIHLLSPKVLLARSLTELQENADIISLHLPLNDKTRGLINSDFIKRLKPGAALLNYARGPVVDEEAVLAALDSGQLSIYINDFPSRSLLRHHRVITTPHLGASTGESEEQCAKMAVSSLKNYLDYGTISHSVNFPAAEAIIRHNIACRLIMINNDIPGMIGFASQIIGNSGINIASYNNQSNGRIGYNIIDLEDLPGPEVTRTIENNPDVVRTRLIQF